MHPVIKVSHLISFTLHIYKLLRGTLSNKFHALIKVILHLIITIKISSNFIGVLGALFFTNHSVQL